MGTLNFAPLFAAMQVVCPSKVTGVDPIASTYSLTDANSLRHVGPMAQDFHAIFWLNSTDDTHILSVDEAGVGSDSGLVPTKPEIDRTTQNTRGTTLEVRVRVKLSLFGEARVPTLTSRASSTCRITQRA